MSSMAFSVWPYYFPSITDQIISFWHYKQKEQFRMARQWVRYHKLVQSYKQSQREAELLSTQHDQMTPDTRKLRSIRLQWVMSQEY